MERARPHASEHDRTAARGAGAPRRGGRALTCGLAAAALLLTGCDSVSGIPVDDVPSSSPAIEETVSAAGTDDAETSGTSGTIATSAVPAPALAPVPDDAPEVGAVPGVPEAVPALRRWAADLENGTIAELQEKCWTLAPGNVTQMYQYPQGVLAALAEPGTATADSVTWESGTLTVTVERAALADGYACPRVGSAGAPAQYNDADARHTVRRYLSRLVGEPLDPADTEDTHPLICAASPAAWDPTGSGESVTAPPAANPRKLEDDFGGIAAFTGEQLTSAWLSADYITVDAPVTDEDGTTQTHTFTLTQRETDSGNSAGYCIGDVTTS
ncbi:hypothetical protein [Nocardia shimofusensis]|uniref:hypothetical protein n=1 Tax=Nocardia shimofusensis TaxID=228596 RepID=UPI00083088F7|nr:hypothetical protein [Nocardia shimofusensis]